MARAMPEATVTPVSVARSASRDIAPSCGDVTTRPGNGPGLDPLHSRDGLSPPSSGGGYS
jgi:hypothetical protein